MWIRKSLALLTGCLALISPVSGQQQGAGANQSEFSAEDAAVQRPVSIPPAVLEILSGDDMVRDALEHKTLGPKQLPQSWFSASATHLGPSSRTDLIVEAQGTLRGANVIKFWVFCGSESGFRLALAAPAHDLEILKTRWKGYREVELSAATAVTFTTTWFRWDGSRYVQFRAKSGAI